MIIKTILISVFKSTSTKIFNAIKSKGASSLRSLADKMDVPKSTFHRHHVNQQKRISIVGHDVFETEPGRRILQELMVSVLLVFGIKSGVGGETISLFFKTFLSSQYLASSANMIRLLKRKMRLLIDEYGDLEIEEVLKRIKNGDLHIGLDETFNGDQIYLVMIELASGFIFHEGLASDRTFKTWSKHIGNFLSTFKTNIKSFISDGGSVLLNLGISIDLENYMDLFHGLKDLRLLFATKFNSKRQHIAKLIREVKANPKITGKKEEAEIKALEDRQVVIDDGQKLYRQSMFDIS